MHACMHPSIHPSIHALYPSIHTYTGNPQSLQQQPLTYLRQVLSLVINPSLLEQHANLVRASLCMSLSTHLSSCSCCLLLAACFACASLSRWTDQSKGSHCPPPRTTITSPTHHLVPYHLPSIYPPPTKKTHTVPCGRGGAGQGVPGGAAHGRLLQLPGPICLSVCPWGLWLVG